MSKGLILLATVAVLGLAGCGDSDLERGATGAAIGGLTSKALGGSFGVGATLGGAAGVICDDANVC